MNDEQKVVEAWRGLTGRLRSHAPVSCASLLPPAAEPAIDAVLRTVTEGPADAMGPQVPGPVRGCLVRENPERPLLDEALPYWTPIH
ncbi:hypothetical protein [Streptomyces sp. NPDC058542]|uniref:hypothetical protein n=1 Tax=Streptomyces sp. NPDC058542 TaxID=3346543 RepID=UPI00365F8D28